ncbi:uncharacterized protein [Ptychodera flava]|uniref:uncharacterized protein n=1 Tax=Ptychodera flava TaxID=63121 RepID=UPI00396A2A3B
MDMLTRVIKDVNMRTLISSYQLVLIVDVKSMHSYNQDGALWRFAHLKSGGRKVIGLLYFMYMEASNPNLVTDLFTCDDLSSLVAEMLSSSSASVLMTDQATGVKAVKALEKKREIVFVTKCETADVYTNSKGTSHSASQYFPHLLFLSTYIIHVGITVTLAARASHQCCVYHCDIAARVSSVLCVSSGKPAK